MNEFEIIHNLKRIKIHPLLNYNDDVFFDKKNSLIASIDTYNENIHYLNFNKPELIIKKVIDHLFQTLFLKALIQNIY